MRLAHPAPKATGEDLSEVISASFELESNECCRWLAQMSAADDCGGCEKVKRMNDEVAQIGENLYEPKFD